MGFGLSIPFDRLQRVDAPALRWVKVKQLPQRRSSRVASRGRFENAVLSEPSHFLLAAKRVVDVTGSAIGMIIFSPLLFAIAMAIKLTSPGPILFRQKRYGYHNRRFWILKFRTMHADLSDQRGTRQITNDDPRVTPIGRLLRKASMDELPQLINVFKGDMSLVGPRPHVPGMMANGMLYEEFIPYYFQRHNMRPGVTGLAQARGYRGATTAAELALARVDCDLEYLESWSLLLDIRLIFQTVKSEFLCGSGN